MAIWNAVNCVPALFTVPTIGKPCLGCSTIWKPMNFGYAIRPRAHKVLERRIAHLLRRRPGRPSNRAANQVERHYANFTYQAKSWSKPRRVVARVEWYPGGLFPRAGFVVTTLPVPDERVFEFYNRRGTAEQYIKQGKYALKWTRLSCQSFKANQVRLQLHALACNMANFLRTLVLPASIADRSLTSLRDRMIRVGKGSASRPLHYPSAGRSRCSQGLLGAPGTFGRTRDLWAQMPATITGLRARSQAP